MLASFLLFCVIALQCSRHTSGLDTPLTLTHLLVCPLLSMLSTAVFSSTHFNLSKAFLAPFCRGLSVTSLVGIIYFLFVGIEDAVCAPLSVRDGAIGMIVLLLRWTMVQTRLTSFLRQHGTAQSVHGASGKLPESRRKVLTRLVALQIKNAHLPST